MTAMSAEAAAMPDGRDEELVALRAELEDTNRGVVALYAELDAQADELRRATDLKSRFLAKMSHEFRTPIGSIQSLARLLIDRVDGPLTEEQERQVRFIQDMAAEFSEMVNDLLDLAKVEASGVSISPGWFELVDPVLGPPHHRQTETAQPIDAELDLRRAAGRAGAVQ